MNYFVKVTWHNGQTLADCKAIYYGEQDEVILWRWQNGKTIIARHLGSPEPYRLPGRNHFAWPDDGSGIAEYVEAGCGCSSPMKRAKLLHPDAEGAAVREHAGR